MQNFSTTQASNLAAIIGVIMLLLNAFKVNITQEEVQTLIGGLLSVSAIVISFISRYKKGDLTKLGFRHDTKLPPQDLT